MHLIELMRFADAECVTSNEVVHGRVHAYIYRATATSQQDLPAWAREQGVFFFYNAPAWSPCPIAIASPAHWRTYACVCWWTTFILVTRLLSMNIIHSIKCVGNFYSYHIQHVGAIDGEINSTNVLDALILVQWEALNKHGQHMQQHAHWHKFCCWQNLIILNIWNEHKNNQGMFQSYCVAWERD